MPSKTSACVYVLLSKIPSVFDAFLSLLLSTDPACNSACKEAVLFIVEEPVTALPEAVSIVLLVYVLAGAAEAYETVP